MFIKIDNTTSILKLASPRKHTKQNRKAGYQSHKVALQTIHTHINTRSST